MRAALDLVTLANAHWTVMVRGCYGCIGYGVDAIGCYCLLRVRMHFL